MGYDRTIRAAMVEQLAETDPEAHAELLHLRRYNPQGYRKRLKRLLRLGLIHRPGQAPATTKAPAKKAAPKKAATAKKAPAKKAAPKKEAATKQAAPKKEAAAKKAAPKKATAKKATAKKAQPKAAKSKK